jgi:hypothetical protein
MGNELVNLIYECKARLRRTGACYTFSSGFKTIRSIRQIRSSSLVNLMLAYMCQLLVVMSHMVCLGLIKHPLLIFRLVFYCQDNGICYCQSVLFQSQSSLSSVRIFTRELLHIPE